MGRNTNPPCGTHSLIYGSTRHHVLSCKGVLSDGSEFDTEQAASREANPLLDAILNFFGQHGMIWLGLAFLLVAVLVAVINFLFNRRFCVFTESLRDCMNKPGWFPEEAEPLRKWMLVLGILSCLGIFGYALNDQSSFQNVCRGVAMILGSVWIRNLDDYRLEDIVIENAPSNDNSWYS